VVRRNYRLRIFGFDERGEKVSMIKLSMGHIPKAYRAGRDLPVDLELIQFVHSRRRPSDCFLMIADSLAIRIIPIGQFGVLWISALLCTAPL
jgi:hypothetical protein